MVATEFSTIQEVRIGESTCGAADADVQDICQTSGGDQHGYALLVLGVLTALLAFGAAIGRSRPAALGLVLVGVVVIAIALVLDRPTLDDTRGLEARYNDVEGLTGDAYTLELIAGALAVLAGVVALVRERFAGRRAERQRGRAGRKPRADADRDAVRPERGGRAAPVTADAEADAERERPPKRRRDRIRSDEPRVRPERERPRTPAKPPDDRPPDSAA